MSTLFCFGFGFCAAALARHVTPLGWDVVGTSTTEAGRKRIAAMGHAGLTFDGSAANTEVVSALGRATHILVSAPPDAAGDPVLRGAGHLLKGLGAPQAEWIGYLSTIGVYGDHQGRWVDEETPANPASLRSRRRIDAELAWLRLGEEVDARVQIFRLAGIYGPGRSTIENVRDGTARRIVKPGQVFNRIHVDDIAGVLLAAISSGGRQSLYNVTDDEPAPPQDVVAYAAELLGYPVPPELPFEAAALSPMAQSFYAENKRVRNERIKAELGVALSYPSYREGLEAISGKKR